MDLSWIKKIAGYAPDIALAIATGGTSAIATTALRIAAKELTGDEHAPLAAIKQAAENATPEQLILLERENNSFKVQMKSLEIGDKQSEHSVTQSTIKNGDNSDSLIVRCTRPFHATLSLFAAIYYALTAQAPDVMVLSALLALPFTYSGLRQMGKWKTTDSLAKLGAKNK